jgi:hypothetical protein
MDSKKIASGQLVVLLCALLIGQAVGEPYNGSFELYEYNETTGFNDPNGWYTENYVTVSQGFIPDSFSGTKTNWRIDLAAALSPFKGNSLLVLSSGGNSLQYAQASQSVSIGEGDKITGVYFFGTCDYRPWNDWSEIKLVKKNDSNGSEILLAFADIELLGENYGSFPGWKRFEHTFTASEVGDYNLVLFVSDKDDYQLESYLVVDGLLLSRYNEVNPPPEHADFTCDGTVDFKDFTILAKGWQHECSNTAYDPNCNCLLGTDLDASGLIDFNDIRILSENWLCGIREE